MKKTVSLILAVLVASSMLMTGCSDVDDTAEENTLPVIEPVTTTQEITTVPTMPTTAPTEATTTSETTTSETTTTTASETTTEATSETTTTATEATTAAATTAATAAATAKVTAASASTNSGVVLTCIKGTMNTGYGYQQLPASEKELYKAVYNAALNLQKNVPIECDKATWYKIYSMVMNEEPELFFLDSSISSQGVMHYLQNDPAVIASMQSELDAKVNTIISQVNACSTTAQKLRYIHDYLCVSNGYDGSSKNIYTSLVKNKAQCVSYAKSVQYLCEYAGIECMVITGINGEGTAHAWNIVKVDGVYYNLDVTWDDPMGSTFFTNKFIRYNYFLVPDSWIHNITHFYVNTAKLGNHNVTYFTPPACSNTAQSYYNAYGRYATDNANADALMKKAIKEGTANKVECIQVKVSTTAIREYLDANSATYMAYAKQVSPYTVKEVRKYNDKNINVYYIVVVYN